VPEVLTFASYPLAVYGKVDGKWKKIGILSASLSREQAEKLIRESRFGTEAPAWRDVRFGDQRYAVVPGP
jgi:hypothetical protein